MPKKLATRGFTLIELMVVMAIISILASVGFTTYTSSQRAGRDSKRIADIQEIQKALEQFYAVTTKYPANLTDNNFKKYFENQDAPTDDQASPPQDYSYVHDDPVSGGTCGEKYVLCAEIESCSGGKCNNAAKVTDPCQSPDDHSNPTTDHNFYCAGSLSN